LSDKKFFCRSLFELILKQKPASLQVFHCFSFNFCKSQSLTRIKSKVFKSFTLSGLKNKTLTSFVRGMTFALNKKDTIINVNLEQKNMNYGKEFKKFATKDQE
jgi:hypothetical protein